MTVYYDGSFEGFLTLIYEKYYQKLNIEKIIKEFPNSLFDDEILEIKTDIQKASKVLNSLKQKFSKSNFSTITNTFLCDCIDFELDLLKFIIVGFKNQKQLTNINLDCVNNLALYAHQMGRYIHRYYAFTRFQETKEGILYATIETDFNIIYFLGRHFFKRLNNQNFIIHDLKRQVAFIKFDQKTSIENVSSYEIPEFSDDEQKFQKLWKVFFKSVSIESRENLKLQQQQVPLIYREFMTEFH